MNNILKNQNYWTAVTMIPQVITFVSVNFCRFCRFWSHFGKLPITVCEVYIRPQSLVVVEVLRQVFYARYLIIFEMYHGDLTFRIIFVASSLNILQCCNARKWFWMILHNFIYTCFRIDLKAKSKFVCRINFTINKMSQFLNSETKTHSFCFLEISSWLS